MPPQGTLASDNRKLLLALLGVLALVFAFVGSNVAANHEPKPHDLPVGLVGSPQATGALAAQLERSAPGSFEFHGYSSLAAAQTGSCIARCTVRLNPPRSQPC